MYEYLDHREARKAARLQSKFNLTLVAAKAVFFLALAAAVLIYAVKVQPWV